MHASLYTTYTCYTRMHAWLYTKIHALYTHACVGIHKYTPIIHACMRRYTQVYTYDTRMHASLYTKYMYYTRMHALVYTKIHAIYTHACVDIHKNARAIHKIHTQHTRNVYDTYKNAYALYTICVRSIQKMHTI